MLVYDVEGGGEEVFADALPLVVRCDGDVEDMCLLVDDAEDDVTDEGMCETCDVEMLGGSRSLEGERIVGSGPRVLEAPVLYFHDLFEVGQVHRFEGEVRVFGVHLFCCGRGNFRVFVASSIARYGNWCQLGKFSALIFFGRSVIICGEGGVYYHERF